VRARSSQLRSFAIDLSILPRTPDHLPAETHTRETNTRKESKDTFVPRISPALSLFPPHAGAHRGMLLRQQQMASGQQVRCARAAAATPKAPAPASALVRLHGRQQQQQHRRGPAPASAAAEESFGDAVKRVAKRVQGALPVIGLLSRLTSPEGGFDGEASATYAEFSRAVYDDSARYPQYATAASELEKRHGRPASPRYLLLALWMADQGAGGTVQARDVVAAMRRLRVTGDMEIEIDRFLGARDAQLQKYGLIAREAASAQARAELGVDALTAVALGLKDGQVLEGQDADDVAQAVSAALAVPEEAARRAVEARAERSLAMASGGAGGNRAGAGGKGSSA
jgi:hypothetical protein